MRSASEDAFGQPNETKPTFGVDKLIFYKSLFNSFMYIVVIAWLYITLLMAFTEANITAGVLTFLFYGLFPCALFVWILGTPQRRRNKLKQDNQSSVEDMLDQKDRTDTNSD